MSLKSLDKFLDSMWRNIQFQTEMLEEEKEEFHKELEKLKENLLKDVDERLHVFQDESRLLKERLMLEADLELKKKRFEIFDSIFTDVVKRVKEKIKLTRKTPRYKKALKGFIYNALKYAPSTEIIVEGNIEDKDLLREIVKEIGVERGVNISLSSEPIETVGGLVIKLKDGTFSYLSTIEVRIEELKEELRKIVMEELI